MMRPIALVAVLAATLLGCQSEAAAIKVACDAPNHVDHRLPPSERGQALADYIAGNVTNSHVLGIMTADQPAVEKAITLQAVATKAGISDCELAALWSKAMPLPPLPVAAASMVAIPAMPSGSVPAPASSSAAVDDRVVVSGAMTVAAVTGVVQASAPSLRACYQEGVKRDRKLEGMVRVQFVVGEEGKVTRAEDAGSAMPDKQVIDCLLGRFKALEFPKPYKGTVTVTYPIELKQG